MKKKVTKSTQPHKILEEQSIKLKEKLESLKQQIQQKKKEKESIKQNNNTQSTLSKSKVSINSESQGQELAKMLVGLQMEHIVGKLREKNINTLQQFKSIKPEVIDHWKDIPIGYRIKLKKQLNTIPHLNHSPQKKLSLQKQKNIEEIIQMRKKERIYVPLTTQCDEFNQDQFQDELSEKEQQVMIKNLMVAFNGPDQIEQIELVKTEKPKIAVQMKQAWEAKDKYPDYHYCWSCLKILQQKKIISYKARSFCGQICTEKYKKTMNIQDNHQFFDRIEKTENEFKEYLQNRNKKNGWIRKNHKMSNQQPQQQVDFDIL